MAEYKDVTGLKKQIADFKKSVKSSNSDYLTAYLSALSVVEGMIAGLPDADVVEVKWIDVNDRLPKNNLVRVLVFLKDNEFTKPIGFNRIDTDRYVDGKWVRWGEHVTHWMPLPEPPSGARMDGGKAG